MSDMRSYRLYQVDSFTTERFRGNPAGVVANADGLSEREMLAIARELNNSETAFIFPPDGPDHDIRLRYFTPTVEVPVCGHATIAAHYVRAVERQLESTTVAHKIRIGTLPVEVTRLDGDYFIRMTQGRIQFSEPMSGPCRHDLLAALGLSPEDLAERCPIQIVSTGHAKVLIGIESRETLDSLAPDLTALKRVSAALGCNGHFVFTLDSGSEDILTHGRMFAPAIGIAEDPVTGNANGPLGAYLVRHRLVKVDGDLFTFRAEQGSAIGRSGVVEVQVKCENGEPVQVKIGGRAVIVFRTEIQL